MSELIYQVAQTTGLTTEQATVAVTIVVNYLKGKLPSPVVGRIGFVLKGGLICNSSSPDIAACGVSRSKHYDGAMAAL